MIRSRRYSMNIAARLRVDTADRIVPALRARLEQGNQSKDQFQAHEKPIVFAFHHIILTM